MRAIIIGPDQGLQTAFESAGIESAHLEEPATGDTLEAADVQSATVLVVTDVSDATAIPIAKDVNPALRVVIYSSDTMPEFVRGQVDLALDPALFEPTIIADELADSTGQAGNS